MRWQKGKFHPLTITKRDGTVTVVQRLSHLPRTKEHRQRTRIKAWREKRQQALQRDGHRCVHCKRARGDFDPRLKRNKVARLEVHHLTYERYGHERLEDLITLCQKCHSLEHIRLRSRA